jgi:predicted NAD-dependent protein-ADP-ribosyltransferase YbiA (DUF1768 family)
LRLAGPKKEKGTQAVGRKSSGPEKSEWEKIKNQAFDVEEI